MQAIEHHIVYQIPPEHQSMVDQFLESFSTSAPDHNPKWFRGTNPGKSCKLYYAICDGKVYSYSLIQESNRTARIFLGPLTSDKSTLKDSIHRIFKHYRKRAFGELLIQPDSNESFSEIEATNLKHVVIDDERNWSTVKLDLTAGPETIRKKFRSGHISSINRAKKFGLEIRELTEPQQLYKLASIFDEMYANRGIAKDFHDTKSVFVNILKYTRGRGGFLLGAYHKGQMLGGILTVVQGDTIYYRYGASKRTSENIPVLHLAFDKLVEIGYSKGINYLDFWGYNSYVDKDSQVGRINYFKTGFGGEVVEYPNSISFVCNRPVYALINFLKSIKKMFDK